MSHSIILKISAAVYVLFGVPLMLAPNALMAIYQAPALSGPGEYNTMLLGSTMIGLGVMNWVASQQSEEHARLPILGTLVADILCFVIALWRQLVATDAVPTGWINVALFLVFGALMARLYFRPAIRTGVPRAAT
jgi:hypothetical protein